MLSSFTSCSTRAIRSQPFLLLRHFANTAVKSKPASRTPVPPTSSSKPVVNSGRTQQIQGIATKILDGGHNELYRNTALRAYVAVAFGIMGGSYVGVAYLYSIKLWDFQKTKERGLSWIVPVANQATMIVWGLLAAYAYSRTLGLATTLKLVRSGNKILLETSIRRPIPFMKPEKHMSELSDLVVNRDKLFSAAFGFENMITRPEGQNFISRLTNALFYTPFHNVRKALGGVGLVSIEVGPEGDQRHVILDADGIFSNGGKDLLDLSKNQV